MVKGKREVSPKYGVSAQTKAEAVHKASELGLVAMFPKPDELLLDIDMPFDQAAVREGAKIMSGTVKCILDDNGKGIIAKAYCWTRSKSGNAHLYIRLNQKVGYHERIILHLLLGSDPKREAFNLIRKRKYAESGYSIALFETPDQAESVTKWRHDKI